MKPNRLLVLVVGTTKTKKDPHQKCAPLIVSPTRVGTAGLEPTTLWPQAAVLTRTSISFHGYLMTVIGGHFLPPLPIPINGVALDRVIKFTAYEAGTAGKYLAKWCRSGQGGRLILFRGSPRSGNAPRRANSHASQQHSAKRWLGPRCSGGGTRAFSFVYQPLTWHSTKSFVAR